MTDEQRLREIVEYAYKSGYHEPGYDVVAACLAKTWTCTICGGSVDLSNPVKPGSYSQQGRLPSTVTLPQGPQ